MDTDYKPLTTFEIAKFSHVSHRTVLKWINGGKLAAYRTPGNHSRVRVEDLLSFYKEFGMPIPSALRSQLNRMESNVTKMLRTTLGKMEVALGSIKEAIVWVDPQGKIQWSNSAFDAILERAHIYVLGANIYEVLSLQVAEIDVRKEDHPAFLVNENGNPITGYYEFVHNNQRRFFYLSASVAQINLEDKSVVLTLQDVTKRRELMDEKERLEVSNKKLRAKFEVQQEFTSIVSHELRTPLASIKSSIDMVVDEVAGPIAEAQKKLLDRAKSNIDRLNRLVNDILDLSKLESGKLDLQCVMTNVHDLIDRVQNVQQFLADDIGVKLIVNLDDNVPLMEIDSDKIEQVFNNLVSNALKYTKEGSVTISSEFEESHQRVVFCVRDTGVGIPEEGMSLLFQKFQQVGDPSNQVEGTGLGLAICKEIVQRHGGRVWAESEVGKGSAFYFYLPAAKGGSK